MADNQQPYQPPYQQQPPQQPYQQQPYQQQPYGGPPTQPPYQQQAYRQPYQQQPYAAPQQQQPPPPYAAGQQPPPPYGAAPYQQVSNDQRDIWETKGKRAVGFGVAWLVGGLVLSGVTYSIAASSSGGGVYFLAWGPVVYGIYRIVSGFRLLNKARS